MEQLSETIEILSPTLNEWDRQVHAVKGKNNVFFIEVYFLYGFFPNFQTYPFPVVV